MKTDLEIVGALALFLLAKTGSIHGIWKGRLSADEQRAAFGCVPFGKCKVSIDGAAETVTAARKVCFGSDFESTRLTWLEMERECRANRHPFTLGRYGKKYVTLPL